MAEQNEFIKELVQSIRKEIVADKTFLKTILSGIELQEENIPPELILTMMNKLNAQNEMVRKPISNAPKDIKGAKVAKPISIGEGSIEAKIVSDLLGGNNVYLMGKAGTGKTYLAKAIAESVMGQPVFLINCSQWTSPIEIRGGQTIRGYEEGQLIKAWAQGGILILDELPKLDPNTAGLLNDALAETASQPKYDSDGKVIPETIPYIVNGRGEKIYKGQDAQDADLRFRFCVIATGNTDMINVGNKYTGNQKQDYSLVDRFAGSYYEIGNDPVKEMLLTYPLVYKICNAIRTFLDSKKDAVQSISLRTMLNFNRTYEQQMLYYYESVLADEIFNNNGERVPPKNLDDSIDSFLNLFEKNMREELRNYDELKTAMSENSQTKAQNDFPNLFMKKYHLHYRTGEPLTEEEIMQLDK